ncbi:hypothetical protein MMC07_008819 [Pseudocyphellaria aurata]|nr:hypothetical protein [Pseudocyphellaria aurata]
MTLLPSQPACSRPPLQTISSLLEEAYAGSPDTPPSLVVFREPALLTDQGDVQPSHPPLTEFSTYPFLAHSVQDLAAFLAANRAGSAISSHQFLIADEQTNEDRTVLLVDRGYEPGESPETVRLDAAHANAVPVAVQVATMDLNGVRALVDDDGVYRGGASRPAPRKGGPAPRKQL